MQGSQLHEITSIDNQYDRCHILVQLLDQGLLQRQQLTESMLSVTQEIFFDLIQSNHINRNCLSYEIIPDDSSNKHTSLLPMIEVMPNLKQSLKTWQKWQNQNLAGYSPNLFLLIKQPELISQENLSESQLSIISLIDGSQNVRILALKTGLDIVSVMLCLLPLTKLKPGFLTN